MSDQARLVGRDAELAVLEAEWQRAAGGELRRVLLSGICPPTNLADWVIDCDRWAPGRNRSLKRRQYSRTGAG